MAILKSLIYAGRSFGSHGVRIKYFLEQRALRLI